MGLLNNNLHEHSFAVHKDFLNDSKKGFLLFHRTKGKETRRLFNEEKLLDYEPSSIGNASKISPKKCRSSVEVASLPKFLEYKNIYRCQNILVVMVFWVWKTGFIY